MIKITKTYTDYNGVEKTEDFYFNLEQSEVIKMEASYEGGLSAAVNRATAAKDMPTLLTIFEDLVLLSYGVKSGDGRRFIKTPEVKEDFKYCKAFSMIYTELATNAEAAAEFVNGIAPDEHKEEVKKATAQALKAE